MADPFQQTALTVQGDPELALIAQVNRWTKRAGQLLYRLAKPISPEVAGYAVALLQQRFASSFLMSADVSNLALMMTLAKGAADPLAYVQAHLSEITQTLARYGDSIGLPPAEVGIVVNRPNRLKWVLIVAMSVGGLGAAFGLHRHLSRRTRIV